MRMMNHYNVGIIFLLRMMCGSRGLTVKLPSLRYLEISSLFSQRFFFSLGFSSFLLLFRDEKRDKR
jgi:hypothetical protein